jgi:hypothetical protein
VYSLFPEYTQYSFSRAANPFASLRPLQKESILLVLETRILKIKMWVEMYSLLSSRRESVLVLLKLLATPNSCYLILKDIALCLGFTPE